MVTRKKILITAGPTWVALDQVRVISNLATGETGFILAEKFRKLGAEVTLLIGPGNFCGAIKGIRLIRFKYFDELAKNLDQELKSRKFAAVIHAAAISDYRPKKVISGKVSSQLKGWKIDLVPTKKLIGSLNNYQPDLFIVGFKFLPDTARAVLLEKAGQLLKQTKLDLVVANSNRNKGYQAFILDGLNKAQGPFLNKIKMADYLSKFVWKLLR